MKNYYKIKEKEIKNKIKVVQNKNTPKDIFRTFFKKKDSNIIKIIKIIIKLCLFVPVILLLIAIGDLDYSYYEMLRIIISILAIVFAIIIRSFDNIPLMTIMIIVAILFNPLFPIYLNKDMWIVLDFICSILFIISAISIIKNLMFKIKVNYFIGKSIQIIATFVFGIITYILFYISSNIDNSWGALIFGLSAVFAFLFTVIFFIYVLFKDDEY